MPIEMSDDDPSWLLVAKAELGVAEIPGDKDNPRILEYLRTTSVSPGDHVDEEIPWCAAFVNWCLIRAQQTGTNRRAARSYLHWGQPVEPRVGAVCVLWREDPKGPKGHVGFFLKETADSVQLLGGNQGNCVSVRSYPKARVLGYRWPKDDG